jgi:tetratricopeptide (TPR) repeat protein
VNPIEPRSKSYGPILDRIRTTLAASTYLTPVAGVPPEQQSALRSIGESIEAGADPEVVRRRIHQLHAAGRIDRVMMLSALGVLSASPLLRDWEEAARLASQQEFAALDAGGPYQQRYLASAYRHRGVIAFLCGWYPNALEWFGRALDREPSPQNLGNVLATLIRLGDLGEARRLTDAADRSWPEPLRLDLRQRIDQDDDLARLRAL